MSYTPHKNDGTPPQHEYYVTGGVDEHGPYYVYCATSGQPTVDSFIRNVAMATRFESVEEFKDCQRTYPGMWGLKLFKVAVVGEVE
jgi:hypothetical protein